MYLTIVGVGRVRDVEARRIRTQLKAKLLHRISGHMVAAWMNSRAVEPEPETRMPGPHMVHVVKKDFRFDVPHRRHLRLIGTTCRATTPEFAP